MQGSSVFSYQVNKNQNSNKYKTKQNTTKQTLLLNCHILEKLFSHNGKQNGLTHLQTAFQPADLCAVVKGELIKRWEYVVKEFLM